MAIGLLAPGVCARILLTFGGHEAAGNHSLVPDTLWASAGSHRSERDQPLLWPPAA
jgi:hypothetical protein